MYLAENEWIQNQTDKKKKNGQNQDSRFCRVRMQSINNDILNTVMIKSTLLFFFSARICHCRNFHLYTFITQRCRTDAINRGPERHVLTNTGLHTHGTKCSLFAAYVRIRACVYLREKGEKYPPKT